MTQLSTRTTHIIAAEINSIKEQTIKMVLNNSIEIGRRLVEAKSLLAHGEWGGWLKESVDYSQSTANNLMKIFDQYGSNQLSLFGSDAKSQALGNLSYTQAVALLGIPEIEREQFVEENDIESMSTRELQQAIKDKQELARKLKESEEKSEQESKEKQKLSIQYAELEQASKGHSELVEKLKGDLEFAIACGNNDEVERLQGTLEQSNNELATSKQRIKQLEDDLNKKPIDVPATVTEYKVPEEVERELQELREKISKQSNDKSKIKFTACWDLLNKSYENLLGVLDEVQAEDPEAHGKYKGAVSGLIGRMAERL